MCKGRNLEVKNNLEIVKRRCWRNDSGNTWGKSEGGPSGEDEGLVPSNDCSQVKPG